MISTIRLHIIATHQDITPHHAARPAKRPHVKRYGMQGAIFIIQRHMFFISAIAGAMWAAVNARKALFT
jgi:hypothetical protein